MKVLFLDFDGPLIHTLSLQRNIKYPSQFPSEFDPKCVNVIKAMQERYGFKVVVSSTIRRNHKSLPEMLEHFKTSNLSDLDYHEHWHTPHAATKVYFGTDEDLCHWTGLMNVKRAVLETKYWRGHEIRQWLEAHPEVTEYLVVDDRPNLYPIPQKNCLWIYNANHFGGMLSTHIDIPSYFSRNFSEIK